MVCARKEGISLHGRIAQQTGNAHTRSHIGIEYLRHLLLTKHIGRQNQAAPQYRAAGKTAAGRKVTVEYYINTVNHDHGQQDFPRQLKNRVIVGICEGATLCPLLGVLAQGNKQHRSGGSKQNGGFTEGIEGTIIQNHTRNGIHRAGFRSTLLHITLRNLVVCRSAWVIICRQIQHRIGQRQQQRHTHQSRSNAVCQTLL